MEYGQIRRPGPVKFAWSGTVVGVEPRILMTRSFDQVQHSYQGYMLRVRGPVAGGIHAIENCAVAERALARRAVYAKTFYRRRDALEEGCCCTEIFA